MYGQYNKPDPYPTKKGLDSCGECVKYLLLVLNLLFFLVGCAIVGIGVYFLVDKSFIATTFGSVIASVATWLLLIAGAIVLFISFFGCMGAMLEKRIMITIYMSILCLIFAMCLTGFILGVVFRTQIGEHVRNEMRVILQDDYGIDLEKDYNRGITVAWDKMQEELYCCSVEDQSWQIYLNSRWYKIQPGVPELDKPFVPLSCCKKDQYGEYLEEQKCRTWNLGPPGKQSGRINEALFYMGCYEAGKTFIYDVSGFIIGFGVALALTLIGGIFMSFALLRYL